MVRFLQRGSELPVSAPASSGVDAVLAEIDEAIKRKPGIRSLLQLVDLKTPELQRCFQEQTNSEIAAKALALKVANLCVARYHFVSRGTTLLSRPYGLEVDPINNCNLACPGCVHSSRSKELHLFEWNSGMLSPARFSALLNDYGPYATEIVLCNYGEPLLNLSTPAFIRLAKDYLLTTALSTNMTAPRFDAEAYAASGLDYMTVSIDGASQAVYEKYRRKGNIEVAFSNIRSLVEAKRRLATQTPVISWQFLAFEHNAHEIESAMEIARQLGVDQFKIATPFDVSWDDPAIKPAAVEPCTHKFRNRTEYTTASGWKPQSPDAAAAINREFGNKWVDRLNGANPDVYNDNSSSPNLCHWLYKNMVMDATGRVIPCCAAPQPQADLVFAELGGTNSDLFNSDKFRLARLSFIDKAAYASERDSLQLQTDPHCLKCDWYGNQERAQIDSPEVRNYLGTYGALFSQPAIDFLSDWK